MASLTHTLTLTVTHTSPEGFDWPAALLQSLPALAATLVSGLALWFSHQTNKRTLAISSRQADIAERQATITERKEVSDSRESYYQAWSAFYQAARALYLISYAYQMDAEHLHELHTARKDLQDAILRIRFMFPNNVVEACEATQKAIDALQLARAQHNSPYSSVETARVFSEADQDANDHLTNVREAVRLFTVHGLKPSP